MAKQRDMSVGDRVKVVSVPEEPGADVSPDIIGTAGTITWITPGFAGEKSVFEVKLDDGQVLNLYAAEIDALS